MRKRKSSNNSNTAGNYIVTTLIFFIVGTIPLLFAGVQPWVWSFYGLCMLIVFIISLWQKKVTISNGRNINGFSLAIALFFATTVLTCIPLPGSVLAQLSQTRHGILTSASNILGNSLPLQTISYIPEKSLAWWGFLVCLGLFFITLRRVLADVWTLKRLVIVILFIAISEAIYGLLQALVPSMGVLWVDYIQAGMGSARGTFVNRNNFAAFIEMTLPLLIGYMLAQGGWRQGERIRKILASDQLNKQALLALGIVVMSLALFFSGSRAGITGAMVGFFTFIFIIHPDLKRRGFFPWALVGGITVLLIIYSSAIGVGPIFERFLQINADNSRLDIWRDSWVIVVEHPFGIGLRNYENVFPIYNQSLITDKTVTYAHNDYLQLLIETGWLGYFALIGSFLVFLGKSVTKVRKIDVQKEPLRYFLACGALSGLVSIGFHGFFDFNLQIPANCVYFVTLLSILYACAWHPGNNARHRISPMSRSA